MRNGPILIHAYIVASFALLLFGCSDPRAEKTSQALARLPTQEDWVDCGTIFPAGAEGAWDHYLWGGFANGLVKKDGVYYLYYQGANSYDETAGTVTWRAIGVATSTDGIRFTKYAQNPVLTRFPNENLEEGAVSSAVFLSEQGEITMYYGANTWIMADQVSADARLAVSRDGYTFVDLGVVIDHSDKAVWGSGDEIFPVIAFQDSGRWFTYYIPNGTAQRGQLGVAWGGGQADLANSAAAREGNRAIDVWGSGSAVRLEDEVYALFLNNVFGPDGPITEVRTVAHDAPDNLSAPLQVYRFENVQQATFFRDEETDIWYMYYRNINGGEYGVRIAMTDGQLAACPKLQVYLPFLSQN